ncbi:MAG: orotidine-5'-phosphate decarboxylase, partial [Patescibacteria group bacterium]|nr:orotidine-5'-phosphate decarboxylase [Patescibacteria group bacterium]
MRFLEKLDRCIEQNNSLVCVGLDADVSHLSTDQYSFNRSIIDQTHDLVCAYKLNSAFYECGTIDQLKQTCEYLRSAYPHIPIILDAKRGDIGNTNIAYASYAFDYLGADAITLHPYLGSESLEPFLRREDKGCIILCRTSNVGAKEFQDLFVDGKPLYQIVAEHVMVWHSEFHNCLLVVGATYPEDLQKLRQIVPSMTFLVPGIGAQGGDLEHVIRYGLNKTGKGLIITSSRAIIFAENPREETQ